MVVMPLKVFPPGLLSLDAPFLVIFVVPWKVVFFMVMVADVMFAVQFIIVGPRPKEVVVAFVTVRVPFCTVPVVKVTVGPLTVSVLPPRSSVPVVSVRLLIDEVAFSTQLLRLKMTVTLSAAPGIPLGNQF